MRRAIDGCAACGRPWDEHTDEEKRSGCKQLVLCWCGHDTELHAVDGRGVTPEPYCEADGCDCPRYQPRPRQEVRA